MADAQQSVEALSQKIGTVLVVLGAMHFFNLYIFSVLRRRAALEKVDPPFGPDEALAADSVS